MYEGHTLVQSLNKLKKRFEIDRVIVVGDRAMLSQANLAALEEAGYQYIVGYRLRAASKKLQEQALAPEGYTSFSASGGSAEGKQEEVGRWKQIEQQGGRRLVVIYSPKRAKKDRQDRLRLIEKARQIIAKGQLKSRMARGAFRYVDASVDSKPELAEEKIREDEKWDGHYAVLTNAPGFSGPQLWAKYRELWRIEQAFRSFKHHLELRPMFVWTPRRILGHLTIAFLAYALERSMLLALQEKGICISEQQLREKLLDLQVSTIQIEGETFLLRSKIDSQSRAILKTFGVSPPPSLTPKDKFSI